MKPSINPNISLIGVAIDLGAGTRGVSLGPSAVRYAGVYERLTRLGYKVKDYMKPNPLKKLMKKV